MQRPSFEVDQTYFSFFKYSKNPIFRKAINLVN
jgi:hypothetical protein